MMHRVVKPFPFAGNGYAVENLNAGDERDFGASTDGLLSSGYIAGIDAAPDAVVDAPHADLDAIVEEQAAAEQTEDTAAPRRGRQRRG